jgi:hypothetical protein
VSCNRAGSDLLELVGGTALVAAAAKDPREHGGSGGPTLSATAACGRERATAGRREQRVKMEWKAEMPLRLCEKMGRPGFCSTADSHLLQGRLWPDPSRDRRACDLMALSFSYFSSHGSSSSPARTSHRELFLLLMLRLLWPHPSLACCPRSMWHHHRRVTIHTTSVLPPPLSLMPPLHLLLHTESKIPTTMNSS